MVSNNREGVGASQYTVGHFDLRDVSRNDMLEMPRFAVNVLGVCYPARVVPSLRGKSATGFQVSATYFQSVGRPGASEAGSQMAVAENSELYLSPTWFVNSDDPAIVEVAREVVGSAIDPIERAC